MGPRIFKAVEEIAPKAGKFLGELGESAGAKIGKWWRGFMPPEDAMRLVNSWDKSADDIFNLLEKSPESLQLSIGEKLAPFRDKITKQMSQLKRSESTLSGVNEALSRKLQQAKEIEDSLIAKEKTLKLRDSALISAPKTDGVRSEIAEIKNELENLQINKLNNTNTLDDLMGKAEHNVNKIKYVQDLQNKTDELNNILKDKGIVAATKYLDNLNQEFAMTDKSLLSEMQDLTSWYANIKNEVKKVTDDVLASHLTSQNLDAPKSFIKEYGRILSLQDGSPIKESWLKNSKNLAYISELETPGLSPSAKVRQLIGKMKSDAKVREKLGLTPQEIAQKFKIPAIAVGAGSIAAVGILNWFSSNPPEKMVSDASKASSSVKGLGVSGAGATIVNSVNGSLSKIETLSTQLSHEFGNDAAGAVSNILPKISAEMSNISNALRQWDTVVAFSVNKEAAQQLGSSLKDMVEDFSKKAVDLGNKVGVKIPGIKSSTINASDLALVQGFINAKVTGQLDETTVSALKDLENRFNAKAGSNRFSGLLVNPTNGTVISYNDLIKLNNLIKKY